MKTLFLFAFTLLIGATPESTLKTQVETNTIHINSQTTSPCENWAHDMARDEVNTGPHELIDVIALMDAYDFWLDVCQSSEYFISLEPVIIDL